MDPVTLVKLTIIASIFLIVVSIGMQTRPEDLIALKDNPRMAVRAMLAMFVIVPLFVIFFTWALPLQQPIPAALIALSLSPMPPILPNREAKTGADAGYVISLQVLAAVASLVLAPLSLSLAPGTSRSVQLASSAAKTAHSGRASSRRGFETSRSTSRSWSRTGASCPSTCSPRRASDASTCTHRCSRGTAAPLRSPGRWCAASQRRASR